MKILLTGGCGYIGTNLTMTLLDLGHHVTVVDIMWFGNYLSPHKNLTIIKKDIREINSIPMDGIDAVVHLAGEPVAAGRNARNSVEHSVRVAGVA